MPTWAQFFNIDEVTWAKLCQAATQKQWSPLALALESHLIDETQFLNWERQNHQTPMLKGDFFNGAPPLVLFKKFDLIKCRAASSMPVTEWNGQIYWAKISNEKSPFEVEGSKKLWFLAPWSGMKKWFALWEIEVAPVVEESALPPGLQIETAPPPPLPKPIPKPVTVSMPLPVPVPPGVKLPASESAMSLAPPPPVPQPAKILPQSGVRNPISPILQTSGPIVPPLLDPTEDLASVFEFGNADEIPNPSFTGSDLKVINQIPLDVIPPLDPSHELEKPSETLLNRENISPEATFVEPRNETMILETGVAPQVPVEMPSALPEINITAPAESPVGLGVYNSEATSALDFSSLLQDGPQDSEVSPPQVSVAGHNEIEIDQAPPPPPIPAPEYATPLAQTNIETIPADEFEKRLRSTHDQDALANVLMGVWQNYFQQIMILLFQQDRLIMWWSNENFSSSFKRGDTVALDTPSVFKIVASTGHPYHGHVMPSPENDNFFQRVNHGQYPEHLTLIPVVTGDRVVAMLLGTTSIENAKRVTLPKLEDDAKVFATTLLKVTAPARKAG